jgi:hypothetical protein
MIFWNIVFLISSFLLLVGWENFNYITTYRPLAAMFGASNEMVVLSSVVVGIDILFLANVMVRAFVSKSMDENIFEALRNDPITRATAFGWGLVTALDVFLTWFFMASEMEFSIGKDIQVPSAVVGVVPMFPLIIAVVTWLAQAVLVVAAGRAIQKVVYQVTQAGRQVQHNRSGPHTRDKGDEMPWAGKKTRRRV